MVTNKALTVTLCSITGCFEDITEHIRKLSCRDIKQCFYCRNEDLWQYILSTGERTSRNATCNRILYGVKLDVSHHLGNISYNETTIGKHTSTLATCVFC